ncbi:MAG: 2-phospho-L-lactate transferase CofD family protein, partial [Actinomycetota bacterium]|nr:2-phospho-L-lactate transferase CofD family protein [Actinomycetota bacterium]
HVSPDLDTVTYTLAGAINTETGWGLAAETWQAHTELAAYDDGRLAWFGLGDRDLGTHLYRTARLAEGATLSEVTAEIAGRWHVPIRLLPMSDDEVATRVELAATGDEIGFQEYFVGLHHDVEVSGIRLAGIDAARAGPDVLGGIASARCLVICPSNPVLSIAPVLATPGVGEAVAERRNDTVAVSPIIAGRALKGPADRILAEMGHEPTVVGVARMWAPYASVLIVDNADAGLVDAVEAEGMTCVVTPTVMTGPKEAAALARAVLAVRPPPAADPAPR